MELNEADKHALHLGRLVANFQSLELILRTFLLKEEELSGAVSIKSLNFNKLQEGEIVSENAFTNWDMLKELAHKYNNNPKILAAGLAIDESLVKIRDAIAHGKVWSSTPHGPFKLLKFSKPKNGKVKVMFNTLMIKEWFTEQASYVSKAILTVHKAYNRLENGKL